MEVHPATQRKTEALVYEYLKRKNSSLAENFKNEFNPLPFPSSTSLTLERIIEYTRRMLSQSGSNKHEADTPNTTNTNQSNYSVGAELIPPGFQQLPNEIFFKILAHLSKSEQLKLRPVQKSWNETICSYLQHNHNDNSFIRIMQDEELQRFISTIISQNPEIHPIISQVEFYFRRLTFSSLNEFATKCGHQFLKYIIHLANNKNNPPNPSDILKNIFIHSPNLQHLTITGNYEKKNALIFHDKLLHLRSLSVYKPGTSRRYYEIKISALENWLSNAPNLETLNCGYAITFGGDEELTGFLTSCRRLKSVGLKIIFYVTKANLIQFQELADSNIRIEHLSLELEEPCDEDANPVKEAGCEEAGKIVSNWINSLSPYLKTFHLDLEDIKIDFKCMDVLETLHLSFIDTETVTESSLLAITSAQFPSLKHVTLHNYPQTPGLTIFDGEVFENVESLYLKEYNFEGHAGMEPWHKIFPKLKHFRMKGEATMKHLKYILGFLTNIETLRLSDFQPSEEIFELLTGGLREDQINWDDDKGISIKPGLQITPRIISLSRLKKLKRLEIDGMGKIKKVVLALTLLTVMRKIQPLDFLGIYNVKEETAGTATLNFKRSVYHKKVKIQVARYGGDSSDSDDEL